MDTNQYDRALQLVIPTLSYDGFDQLDMVIEGTQHLSSYRICFR